MSSPQNREEALFQAAAQLTGAERAAFLNGACLGDKTLRQRLETLLAANESHDSFLEPDAPQQGSKPVATMKLELTEAPDEAVGQTLGRYKLLERVGEGGCGVVYVAEQTEPVRRRVALKVIKLGMDTKQVVARFEAERQALAMMDHPNIAKVLDAGTTDVGRPYFVMELVRGIKITDYCDQANLTTKERLDLFIKVCQAIQHAHQKGIIHRDIKPSNILVTLHDGVPVPKVIDFGIAKATEGRLTDATVYTQLHQFIGTPAYMSPEQAEMSGLDIDTRSDIYSLGVLLYELLAGSTPFDGQELMASGIDGMRKTIREKEPQRPSTKLSQTLVAADKVGRVAPRAPSAGGNNSKGGAHGVTRPTTQSEEEVRADSRRLLRVKETITLIKGDLDWIVMKCLEKDRTRRYETANGLAADLKRHLNNEPVLARPPSTAYKFQKAFRRNKVVFAAGLAVTAALMLGVIASAWQAVRATHAQHAAVAAEQEQARLRAKAEQEAVRSKKIAEAGLELSYGNNGRAEQILNALPLEPSMLGLFSQLGKNYARYGRWQRAITNYMKVAELSPSDPPAQWLAVLNFQVGDMEGFKHWRAEFLRLNGTETNAYWASFIARVCLIAPPAAGESKTIGNLVDCATKKEAWSWSRTQLPLPNLTAGLWEYRQGHFAAAKERLQTAAGSAGDSRGYWNRQVQAFMLLALAEFQLKQRDDARATLARGFRMADEKMIAPGNDLGDETMDWLLAHFWMREAAGLMPEVVASNSVFAGIVAEKPPWQMALSQAGLKFSSLRSEVDGRWTLSLDNQLISDLSLLRGAPITTLSVQHTAVTDLTPLSDQPLLKELRLAGTKVSDLSPLQGLALVQLTISGTPVSDLSPLHGMPLRDLKMSSCQNITNLEPLAGMTTLQTLILPPKARNYEFLRGMTNLTRLGFKYDAAVKGPDKTAAEFWADYDQTRNENKTVPVP